MTPTQEQIALIEREVAITKELGRFVISEALDALLTSWREHVERLAGIDEELERAIASTVKEREALRRQLDTSHDSMGNVQDVLKEYGPQAMIGPPFMGVKHIAEENASLRRQLEEEQAENARLIQAHRVELQERDREIARLVAEDESAMAERNFAIDAEEKALAQLTERDKELERLRGLIESYTPDTKSPFPIVALWDEGDRIRVARRIREEQEGGEK